MTAFIQMFYKYIMHNLMYKNGHFHKWIFLRDHHVEVLHLKAQKEDHVSFQCKTAPLPCVVLCASGTIDHFTETQL